MAGFKKSTIVIIYKKSKRKNAKVRMKVYKNSVIDYVLDKNNKLLGITDKSEILHIGVGDVFIEKWKEKYNL